MPIKIPLFGFEIWTKSDVEKEKEKLRSIVPPTSDDGAVVLQQPYGSGWKTYLDQESRAKNDVVLITKYRDLALIPECDAAIDEIVNESIVLSGEDLYPIELVLDNVPIPGAVKEKMREEFENIMSLLEFGKMGYDIYRRWYIDGRIFFHLVIDETDPKSGIKDIRYVDPRKIKKVREVVKTDTDQQIGNLIFKKHIEYYVFNENGVVDPNQGLRVAKDSIAYIHSGIVDQRTGSILSCLHKAMKVANCLNMLENSLVIYRLARAPERRIFYIDVGGMPTLKAEQYMQSVMNSMKNQITYDSSTGEVITNKRFSPMLEDFFLARRDGSQGTKVETLPGGQNLGQMEDVEYFKKKLYEALNVPISRLNPEDRFGFGRTTEITREEVKFNRFITRLRSRFSDLFNQILEVQLSLKNVMTRGDFEKIKQTIAYEYAEDNYFSELKESEILQNRMMLLSSVDPLLGKYFSKEWIVKNVLHMTEEEYEDILNQIDHEKSTGEIPEQDPFAMGMGGEFGPMLPGQPPGMGAPPGPPGLPPPGGGKANGSLPGTPQGMLGGPPAKPNGAGGPKKPPLKPKKKSPQQLRSEYEQSVDNANMLIEALWRKSRGRTEI